MSDAWPEGPLHPAMPSTELHVWRAPLGDPGWPGPEHLPAEERQRAEKMRRPGAAAQWTAARWALRHVLARYLDEEPAAIRLAAGPEGKPRLERASSPLRFNLSHSGEIALVALSVEHPVGIDVEEEQPEREPLALAERALGPEDVAAVREAAAAEQSAVFHRRWARHEARLKCSGVGIFRGPSPEGEPVAVGDLDLAPGYAAAVAIGAPALPPLCCWTFDPGALQKDGSRVS